MRFLSLPKIILFFASIFSRKNRENHGFWPPKAIPKPSQNAFKIDVPKNIQFLEVFCHCFCMFVIFETLKISIFPRENHYFQGFRQKRVFALFDKFSLKKPSKNPSKTEPDPFQNRCQERIVFQRLYFRASASILAASWASKWKPKSEIWPQKTLGQLLFIIFD